MIPYYRLCYIHQNTEPWETGNSNNGPFKYDFEYEIIGIQEVNDDKETVKLEMYFSVKWKEPRIRIFEKSFLEEIEGQKNRKLFVPISLENLETLWTPELNIYGLDSYESEKFIEKPMASLKMSREKTLSYNQHYVMTLYCKMDFDQYPFDYHSCEFRAGSYAYNSKIVDCSSTLHRNLEKFGEQAQHSLQYKISIEELPTNYLTYDYLDGNFSSCGFGINLEREMTHMMVQTYVTSIILVITSWLSFMINPAAISGRMGMLVTLFLALINIFIAVKTNAPGSKNINAVDIFLIACVGFHFGALFEYIFVMIRYGTFRNQCKSATQDSNTREESDKENFSDKEKDPLDVQWNSIDKFALVTFFITYSMFLIFYFYHYKLF